MNSSSQTKEERLSGPIKVNIKYTNEIKKEILIPENMKTVVELKELVGKELDIPAVEQRLIFAGKLLKDTDELSKYELRDGCTIHLVRHGASKAKTQTEAEATVAPPTTGATLPNIPGAFQPVPNMGAMPMDQNYAMDIMRNPEVMRGVSQIIESNPALLQSMMQNNPNFQALPPEMRNLMANPDFVRTMLNPEVMSSMMSAMGQNNPQGMNPSMQTGSPSQFQVPWNVAGGTIPPSSQEPPSVRFATQIEQLKQMGFYDEGLNIQALTLTNGNVNAAVDWLLSRPF